jgi:hypothetical protein
MAKVGMNASRGRPIVSRSSAASISILASSRRPGLWRANAATARRSTSRARLSRCDCGSSRCNTARKISARGSRTRKTRWPNPITRPPPPKVQLSHPSMSPAAVIASSMSSTKPGAPPCKSHRHRVALEPDTGNAHKERRSDSAPPSSPPPHGDLIADAELRRARAYSEFRRRLHTAGPHRGLSSPPAGDAAAIERRAHIERLRRAFFRER